ncbi:MAG: hypothetical protein K2P81_16185 [Bacteriovoracaceae bacterium]|nr:hypothetical protein [Bacteriovoracaceae bacterium]
MKLLVCAVLALSSFSVFARSASEVIQEIEAREGVQCYQVSQSRVELCLGMPGYGICRFTKTYDCFGSSEFSVKLRMKSVPSDGGRSVSTSVSKVTIIR